MQIYKQSIYLLIFRGMLATLLLCLLGCDELDGTSEHTGQSYEQYVRYKKTMWFDPKGASDISQHISYYPDGYDVWWRFSISRPDFNALVRAVSSNNHGPKDIKFNSSNAAPANWEPESKVPTWWAIASGHNPQSFRWCYSAGTAEGRHHGWFFVHNAESNIAWCWHWNHQWSSKECP